MKRLILIIIIGLCLCLGFGSPVSSAPEEAPQVKELNFVFLHGAGGTSCSLQLLEDTIKQQLPEYTSIYEQARPWTKIEVNTLLRCYPNNVDIGTWAGNIASSIGTHLAGKKNLILIGHSMGGKAALYAVSHNLGNLAEKTALVVTINSPIKKLQNYYFTGGTSAVDYYRTFGVFSEGGVSESVVYYDSSQDGRVVAMTNHWLALISAESAPLGEQFNVGGVDALPRDMDDNIIPLSAQYSFGADAVYYGEHSHNDFTKEEEVAALLSEQILHYIFGGYLECFVLAERGSLEHKAGWLPGTDVWDEIVGEVLASSGSVQHFNESYTSWQEWEDVVGECLLGGTRSSYRISQVKHFPFLASVEEVRWSSGNPTDCQLYLKTKAAPRNQVEVNWSIYDRGLLPSGTVRNHYEVEITTGTPLANIKRVSWVSSDTRDLRLRIHSEAERPFRWFKAEWRTYSTELRYRRIIDGMP